jgi:diguanylate cyclase (GGDEF)-like protein/PAS domain S-box-containing protein
MKVSLRYKATLLIAVTQLALLGLLLFTNLFQTREHLEDELELHAQATAELVATSATDPLLGMDIALLNNLVQGVVDRHRVRHIGISDHQGRILAEAGRGCAASACVHVERPIAVANTLFGTVTLDISRAETDAALAATTRTNFLIAGLEIVLVTLISLTLGWFLTRNLETLSRAARAIGDGDYRARVPLTARDEVGMLAARFNDMAAQLERHVGELDRSRSRFRDMADNISDWLWETDVDGRYTYSSKRAEMLLGCTPDELLGTRMIDLMTPEDARRLGELLDLVKRERHPFYGFEYCAARKDGGLVVLESNGSPILDSNGNLAGYRGVTRDVTRRKDDESRLVYLAEHDPLTGLLSRQKFLDILADEIRLATPAGTPVAVLFLDLDDFKLVNDTHGHLAGDSLLRVVADILAAQSGERNYLARLGGDEFGVVLRGFGPEEARQLAKRLLAAIEAAQLVAGEAKVRLSACAGVCCFPEGGYDSETLLAHADIAMSRAKTLGHNRYHVYQTSDKDADSMRRTVNWQTVLQDALETDNLTAEFQPIVCISGRSPRHYFEALVRLRDRDGVVHTAARFMDTAEYTGQITEIDKWMLRRVLAMLADRACGDCCIALNLSGRSLGTPGFEEYFLEQLAATPTRPEQLIFEVTETAAIAEMARARSFIATMKKLGYRFSLDDFGVGFSSFSHLKHLPVDQIKIDGGFIRHLESNREDQIFVRAIVQVARELGLETVAEFVGTEETLAMLFDIGIDYVQGYQIAKPGPTLVYPTIERPAHSAYKCAVNSTRKNDDI